MSHRRSTRSAALFVVVWLFGWLVFVVVVLLLLFLCSVFDERGVVSLLFIYRYALLEPSVSIYMCRIYIMQLFVLETYFCMMNPTPDSSVSLFLYI